jgi:hypothetical protein
VFFLNKVLTWYQWMHNTNLYGINETIILVMPASALKVIEAYDVAMKMAANHEEEGHHA